MATKLLEHRAYSPGQLTTEKKSFSLPIYTPENIIKRDEQLAQNVTSRLESLRVQRQLLGVEGSFLQLWETYRDAHRYIPVQEDGSIRFIHYLDTGILSENDLQKEPILLLPGVTNGVEEQLPLVSAVSHKRIIVPDYTTLNPRRINDDILQVLSSAGIEDPIKVLTISIGGTYAQRFSKDHPDKVKALVAWAPVLLGGEAFGGRDFYFLEWLLAHKDTIPWLPVRTVHDIVSRTRFRRSEAGDGEMSSSDRAYRDVLRVASRQHLRASGKKERYNYLDLALQATKESRQYSENTLGVYDWPVVLFRAKTDKVTKKPDDQKWGTHFPNTTVVEVDSIFGHHSLDNIPSQILPAIAVALEG